MDGSQCALCGSRKATHFETIVDNSYTIVYIMCTACGLVRQWPRSSEEEIKWFNDYTYREDRSVAATEGYEKLRAEVQFQLLKDEIDRPNFMLDVGCSTGELLSRFKRHWSSLETWGVEPIDKMRGSAANKGHKVFKETWQIPAYGPFDLITMSHVLEHVLYPSRMLYTLKSRCRPTGRLFIEVPNLIEDLALEKAHLWAFTENTFTAILESSGWKPVWIKKHGAPKHPWLQAYLSVLAEPMERFSYSSLPAPGGIAGARKIFSFLLPAF